MGASELLELQTADDRIARLEADIAGIEARISGSDELERARGAVEAASAARRRADADVAAADLEATALRERTRILERQLYGGSVRGAAELVALQRELEDAKGRLRGSEETELALMELAEGMEAEQAEARTALEAVEAERRAQAGPDAERLAALRVALDDAVAERDLIAGQRGAGELALYRRLTRRHHPAVVRLLGDACGGCRLPLGMREVRAVRTGSEIVQCSNCDRVVAP